MTSFLFIWAGLITACDQRPETVYLSGRTMGTGFHITIVPAAGQTVPERVVKGVRARLEEVNQHMSTYREDSELSRLNRSQNEGWQPISPQLAIVIDEALSIAELTDGALDITLGPLVDLWGFGPSPQTRSVPSDERIQSTLARVGYQRVAVQLDPPRLKKPPGVHIDLSAIAKGYGADVVAEYLEDQGYSDFLVEIGGEVVTRGVNDRGRPWRIGVEKPAMGHQGVQQAVAVSGKGMATSGDYRNYFERDGERYSHIIDPRTGRPVTHRLASVTVIADSSARADGLATALLVMGPEEAMVLAERQKLPIYVIIKDSKGFTTASSPAFDPYRD